MQPIGKFHAGQLPWPGLERRQHGIPRRRAWSTLCRHLLQILLQSWLVPLLLLLAGLPWAPAAAAPSLPSPLRVESGADLPLWPGISVWADADAGLGAEQVMTQASRFRVPQGTPSNLGRSAHTVWLRVGLHVAGTQPLQRVLEINYPPLNRVDVYLVREGQVLQHLRLGSALRKSERVMPARSLAAPLLLAPGDSELLLHVQTQSSLVLPITLRTTESFTEHESLVQIVQGLVLGLALCMMLYSLTHWFGLRDTMFLDYAVLLAANVVFTLAYSGVGAQYLWPEWPALSMAMAPMAVMVAVAAATRFMSAALAVHELSNFMARLLRLVSWLALATLAATLAKLVDYRTAQSLVTLLGLAAIAGVLPAAYVRARRGERAAMYILFGWAAYTVGALLTAGLLRGLVEPTFWNQHTYPLSLMVEMAAWMAVLGLRVQTIRRNADRARLETETLRTLAQTDSLTGLCNRRGLLHQLSVALPLAAPTRLLALYLLDLDGFKPVNDRYGHDVGDALLVAVGQRLQMQLRGGDVVARLGGDEFVVLASGLADEAAALAVGQKLLAAVDAAFLVAGQHCEVGLTVGYALAPLDGHDADELIKRADAAMYAGKQAGRHRVQRGGRSLSIA